MKELVILIKKDFKLLFLRPEVLWLSFLLTLLLSIVIILGFNSVVLPQATERLFPLFLFLIFIFSGSISHGKSLSVELEAGANTTLKTFHVPAYKIYLSKFILNSAVLFTSFMFAVLILGVFLDQKLHLIHYILLTGFLVSTAFSALTTLLVAISAVSRLDNLLLPLILIPFTIPLFFSGMEIISEIILNHRFLWNHLYFSLLILLNFIYVVIGMNLYGYVR